MFSCGKCMRNLGWDGTFLITWLSPDVIRLGKKQFLWCDLVATEHFSWRDSAGTKQFVLSDLAGKEQFYDMFYVVTFVPSQLFDSINFDPSRLVHVINFPLEYISYIPAFLSNWPWWWHSRVRSPLLVRSTGPSTWSRRVDCLAADTTALQRLKWSL